MELSHPEIEDKYHDKILYDYPLKQFRDDGYSKEVNTLQADLPKMVRALQAVVISQYRKKVAERHGLILKPVVMMKANRVNPPSAPDPNKVVSEEFRTEFHQKISSLTPEDLSAIRDNAQSPIVKRAFAYFKQNKISLENLIRELQSDFSEERALSVDSKSQSEEHQILVNSLEEASNKIRVIFAVEMLNEGWDVLNLFDIVRLYDTRDAKAGRPGRTTISEAQLIGRGARYFPFQVDESQPRYQRKFDDDLDNDMRILEELYYHSAHNPRYIQELHTALVDIGMLPERTVRQLELKVKDSFRQSEFWNQGLLFSNKQVRNDNAQVFDLQASAQGIPSSLRYPYRLRTGHAEDSALLEDPGLSQTAETITKVLTLTDFGIYLLRSALSRIKFYEFKSLNSFFPNVGSISDFITSESYLNQIEIEVTGTSDQLQLLFPKIKREIATDVLRRLAEDVRRETPDYKGTHEFKPKPISLAVKEKTIIREFDINADVGTGMRETRTVELQADLSKEDWYIYDENYGTSEEKALVKFIQSQIPELRKKYEDIFLLRNEKLFKIYSFDDGQAFEPDFVLFITDRASGKSVNFQLFIEPKGEFLIKHDQWKEDFLDQIQSGHKIIVEIPNRNYTMVGLPFYNREKKRQAFGESFKQILP